MEEMKMQNMCVRVNEKIWNDFRMFIHEKHGRTKGVLGIEVEAALKVYMNMELDEPIKYLNRNKNPATDLAKKNKNKFPIVRRKDRLQNEFRETCKFKEELSIRALKLLIKAVGFKSESTIDKYIIELEDWGYIEPIRVGTFRNKLFNPQDVEKNED